MHTGTVPFSQNNEAPPDEDEEEGSNQGRKSELRKKRDKIRGVETQKRFLTQQGEKHQNEDSLKKSEEEDKNELGRKTLEVELGFKKIRPIEKERSRKSIKAQSVSGEKVDQIAQQEGQDSARDRRKGKPEIKGEDQHEVRPDSLNGKEPQEGSLKGEDKDSKKEEEEDPFHHFLVPPPGVFFDFFTLSSAEGTGALVMTRTSSNLVRSTLGAISAYWKMP